MADFSRLKFDSPFLLEKPLDKEEMEYRKLIIESAAGTQYKVNVPILRFAKGSEHVMFCLDEFAEVANTYTFSNEDNWEQFRAMLGPNERQEWDSEASGTAAGRTAAAFTQTKAQLLLTHFTWQSFQQFLDCVRVVRKPWNMTAQELQSRLTTLYRYSQQLPNSVVFPQRERKRLFINMFLEEQRDNLQRAKDDPLTMSLSEIAEFFPTYEKPEYTKNDSGKRIRGGGNTSSHSNSQKKGKTNRGSKKDSGATNSSDDSMCRLHAYLGEKNHKWKMCVYNRNGPKYNPNLKPPNKEKGKEGEKPATGNTQSYTHQYAWCPVISPANPAVSYQHGMTMPGATTPGATSLPQSHYQTGQYGPIVLPPVPPPPAYPVPAPPAQPRSYFHQN